ncbi:Smad nuclear interacting protein-like protein [Tribonema minus]|uniref:Smad nuclear interacting protein-like protein n=1 Tax=Tribonema minus TaxID=303371 RepID=A0A836CP18_9STRA|nr:Smad nuclear interacting protein-like protein [Tribonema minus]
MPRRSRSRSRSRDRRSSRQGDSRERSRVKHGASHRSSSREKRRKRSLSTDGRQQQHGRRREPSLEKRGDRRGHVSPRQTADTGEYPQRRPPIAAAAERARQQQHQQTSHYGPAGTVEEEAEGEKPKPKPVDAANFGLSGALAKDAGTGNVYKGIVLKWTEPADARPPTRKWRLYVFKGEAIAQTLYVHRQSAYLIGRERKIADIPVDHPSCSKQHAVLQFRLKETVNEAKMETVRTVRPYVLDLESTNGTWLNKERIEAGRYVELMEGDCLRFGNSTREYVLLHDKSQGVVS